MGFEDYKREKSSRGYGNRSGGRRDEGRNEREVSVVTCDGCGDKCKVPFKPRNNKPVYCDRCFRKNASGDEGRFDSRREPRESRSSSRNEGGDFTQINEKLDEILSILKR